MKNIQITSRATDHKILGALALLGLGGFLAGGFVLIPSNQVMPWALAGISIGLAFFVFSIYRLVQPPHPDKSWKTAAITLASLTWLMLMVAAYLCVDLMIQRMIEPIQDITNTMI